MSPAYNLKAL